MNPSLHPVAFQKHLLRWFDRTRRDLPWRHTRDPYPIWVSEVMLQQTRVAAVIPYYNLFLQQFPTPALLAAASEEAVLKAWEGLGYYARARNLRRAAAIVVDEHGSRVPDQWETLRRLPGIGDYIAAAVLSIAFDQPWPVLDGNVKRVLARLYCLNAPVNDSRSHAMFVQPAQSLLNHSRPGLHNQAMMELGALVCTPKGPCCDTCPVADWCRARQESAAGRFPVRRVRAPAPLQHIAVGVVQHNGRVLITRRASGGLLGGLWEFPGGRMLPGEAAGEACRREIQEETGLKVNVLRRLTCLKHAYTHFKIQMRVFLCELVDGSPVDPQAVRVILNGPVDYRWITLEELERYPLPRANLKFIPLLKREDYAKRFTF